jgi:hypothetical protein
VTTLAPGSSKVVVTGREVRAMAIQSGAGSAAGSTGTGNLIGP